MGLSSAVAESAVRSGFAVRILPRLKEKDEQHDRQRDNEGGSNDGRGASVKRVREGLLEDVETHTKKCHNDESGQAPEGVHQAAAHRVNPSKNPAEQVQGLGP